MYDFDRRDQVPPDTPVACLECGWSGRADETNHLAGEPRCPAVIEGNSCNAWLVVLEEGDEGVVDQ